MSLSSQGKKNYVFLSYMQHIYQVICVKPATARLGSNVGMVVPVN